jgi:hypothetical protein
MKVAGAMVDVLHVSAMLLLAGAATAFTHALARSRRQRVSCSQFSVRILYVWTENFGAGV